VRWYAPIWATPMLEIANVSACYGKHRALDGVSLTVGRGELVLILGANGAGKTTLLKCVAGLVAAAPGGAIAMAGNDLAGVPAHRIVEAGIALVPEGRGIFSDLTVAENLMLGAFPARARAKEADNLAMVLRLFPPLGERLRQTVRTMSGGEQQMVAIGRALMTAPEILLLDEPSLGLSPLMCKTLFQTLKRIRDAGLGIMLVEQNAKQSLEIADRGYLIESGRIVGEGSSIALKSDPAVQRAYLGGAEVHVAMPAPEDAAAWLRLK
jgi:branched-chain amino acid transport system ATP-binding protein